MEMHQIRYFLAVSETLNFTRAAEACHVAQPSLTRAIKLLEAELGEDLFRRERQLTHLTDFGRRMLPMLRQSYESAVSAKELAASLRKGQRAHLTVALDGAVDMALIAESISETARAFEDLELNFVRGGDDEILEALKRGEAELAIGRPFADAWERLDSWELFAGGLALFVHSAHELAERGEVDADALGRATLVLSGASRNASIEAWLRERGSGLAGKHSAASNNDATALARAGVGAALLPEFQPRTNDMRRLPVVGLDQRCEVFLHAVAGRQRSPAAAALAKLLRARDWDASLKTAS